MKRKQVSEKRSKNDKILDSFPKVFKIKTPASQRPDKYLNFECKNLTKTIAIIPYEQKDVKSLILNRL